MQDYLNSITVFFKKEQLGITQAQIDMAKSGKEVGPLDVSLDLSAGVSIEIKM